MKKLLIIIPIALIVLTGYYLLKPVTKINIQPLGEVSPEYIDQVKKSIKSFYGYDCVVLPKKEITKDMLSKERKRVDADKALLSNKTFDNYLFITEKDICYYQSPASPEFGILGLGITNGKTCIVSTFRLKKQVTKEKVTKKKILERLEKVALHELGHNLGLNHCFNSKVCMMHAADGTVKQVDREKVWFCEKCSKQIKK
jgi:archaemetzincin